MAATASIVIEVTDQATPALQRVNAEAAKLGPNLQGVPRISEQAFNSISGGALRARESAALLSEEVGIHIPRALRGVIAQSALLGPAFEAAFSGLAIAGFIQILATSVMKFAEDVMSLSNTTKETVWKIQQEALKAEMSMLESAQSKSRDLQMRTAVATANDLQKLDIKYHSERQTLFEESLKAEEQARLTGEHDVVALANKNLLQLDAAYAAEKKQLLLKESDDVKEASDAAVAASKVGRDRILADAKVSIDKIIAAEDQGGLLYAVAQAKRLQISAETNAKLVKFDEEAVEKSRLFAVEKNKTILQAEAAAATGREHIEKELLVKLNEISMREVAETLALKKLGITEEVNLDGEREAARAESLRKIEALEQAQAKKQRVMEDQTLSMEKAAAVAMAPPWLRAYDSIAIGYQETMDKIKVALDAHVIDQAHAARQEAAAQTDAFAKARDQMANDMETLFNDVTSGNIGKTFLALFKKMVFEMVATWILAIRGMRAASQGAMGGGGGGFLSAIFGGGGGGGFGGGASGGGSSWDSGVSASALQDVGMLSGMPSFSSGGSSAGIDSIGSLPTALSGGAMATMGPLIGVGLSAGQGAGALGTIMPSGAGGGAGGAGFTSLIGKLFTQSQIATLGATGGLALLADGYKRGGVKGVLESIGGGFLAGAGIGFMIGGPFGAGIGALVGTIVGAISGLIGAIFGHSTKKARLAIEANIKQQAATIEDAYNLFQTDWTGSRTALEALRQQGVDALTKAGVKDISRSRVGHVDQWIDKAEKEIDVTQAERNRRNALTFGPPQFRVGGLVGPNLSGPVPSWFAASAMHFAGGGAVPAFLHQGEYVMRSEAVSRIGVGALSNMNSGGGGGGATHIHVSTMDSQSFAEWLRGGGLKEILRETRRAQNEGWA